MIDTFDLLRENPALRQLLEYYCEVADRKPDVEWHDRIMEMHGADAKMLTRLHGQLLANGWIETRVHFDAIAATGDLRECYKPTRDGVHALRLVGDFIPVDADEDDDSELEDESENWPEVE